MNKILNNLLLKVAVILEDISVNIRKNQREKFLLEYIKRYNFDDGFFIPKKDRRFNPYECTNLIIFEKLLNQGEISKEDNIFEVGCGAGILLFFLLDHGFKNVAGIEMNKDLYNLAKKNLQKFINCNNPVIVPKIILGNALSYEIDALANCFYFYNPFFDEQTYKDWLEILKKSLIKNKRKVKIIFLYPTLAALDAVKSCSWLKLKKTIKFKEQVCYTCIRFNIYENINYDI